MIIQVGEPSQMFSPPPEMPQCGDFRANGEQSAMKINNNHENSGKFHVNTHIANMQETTVKFITDKIIHLMIHTFMPSGALSGYRFSCFNNRFWNFWQVL